MPFDMNSFQRHLSLETSSESLKRTNDSYTSGDNGSTEFERPMESRPRQIETHHSLDERSLNDIISSGLSSPRPPRQLETVKSSECLEALLSPSIRSSAGTPREHHAFEPHPMIADAWEALRRSMVFFRSKPVGTIAALDPTEDSLNYNQVCLASPLPCHSFFTCCWIWQNTWRRGLSAIQCIMRFICAWLWFVFPVRYIRCTGNGYLRAVKTDNCNHFLGDKFKMF